MSEKLYHAADELERVFGVPEETISWYGEEIVLTPDQVLALVEAADAVRAYNTLAQAGDSTTDCSSAMTDAGRSLKAGVPKTEWA